MVIQKIRSYIRWLSALIAGIVLVGMLTGGLVLHYVEKSLVTAAGQSLTLAAVDIADKLDMQMAERYGDIQLLSRSLVFQGDDQPAKRQRLLALLETYPVYRWAGVTDEKGRLLAATDEASKGRDMSGEPGFLAVRAGHHAIVQDAAPDDDGVFVVTFVSPLKDSRGRFMGTVISQVGLPVLEDTFARSVNALQAQWGTGARIEYLFLDHDGNIFVDSWLREEGRINLKQKGTPSAQLFDMAPAGFIEERHSRRQVEVVTGYAQTKGAEDLKGLRWGVLVRVDRSDILVPIWAVLWKVGAAGSAIFLPLVAVLIWSISRLTHSWEAADEEHARAQATEHKFRTVLEMAPDAIMMTDAEGTIVLTNEQVDQMFGYPPGQLIGQPVEILVPEVLRNAHRTHREHYHASPQTRSMGAGRTLTGRRQDGTEFPIQASLGHIESAEGSFVVAILRDLSQEHMKQAERERLGHEMHLLLDSTIGGLYGLDGQGRCTFINRAGAELLGYQPDELLGRNMHEFTHHSHQDGSSYPFDECPICRGCQDGEGCQIDDEVLWRRDGTSFPSEIASRPVYEASVLKGAVVTFADITERKQAQEERQKALTLLTNVINNTPDLIFVKGRDLRTIMCNNAFAQAIGKPPADLLGHTDVENGWDPELVYGNPEKGIRGFEMDDLETLSGKVIRIPSEPVSVGSEIRMFDTHKVPLRSDTGEVIGVLGIARDITERKRFEEALREREVALARFKATLDQTHDCVFMFAPDTLRFIYCNRGAVEQVGYSEAELFTMTPVDIMPGFTEQSFREMLQPLRDGRRASHVFETVHQHKDGHAVAVEVSLQLVWEQGEEGRFLAVVRNITERRQAEEEIKTRASWQKAVLDYAGYAIIASTPDGIIQTFNCAAERMLGYRAEEVIGKMTPAVIHDPEEVADRAKTFSNELGEQIEPGFEVFVAKVRRDLPNEHEWTYIRKDGSRFPVLLSITALRSSSGEITGFLGLALDITHRKQSEAALRAYAQELELINQSLDIALDQAEAATEAKSTFLATMSHEIRTPMNGVIGMTGLLLETDLTPEQRELAETVRSSSDHLLTVINDILDFSKIEAGKMTLEIIDFDLRTAVDEAVDLLAERAASKGLNLACLFHAEVPAALCGDPGRLRQILINLMGNAIKFTEQGDVVLTVALLRQTDTDATIRFEVQDTGIGLSPETQRCLFQSFSQADSSTTRKFGGTGLGLAICKQLTELMDGQIGVDSKLGEGSTFWFTVQLGKQPQASALVTALASQDLQGLQLCIVDDSPINRRILELYATRWGVRCLMAVNGQQALALMHKAAARGQACDLAIIDMQLPGMNGLELADAIKADPALAPTRLVLLTSQGQRGDAKAAQAAGYAAYLSKPVHEPQLYDCLTTVLKLPAQDTACEGQSASWAARPKLVTRHSLAEKIAQATGKILVAEDNVINQKVAVRILEKLGYRADLVANGLEVLDALTHISYDAVLMDCHMPEMDGFAATEEIRRREAMGDGHEAIGRSLTASLTPLTSRHVPIIAMTANAMQEDRDRCLAAGMDDYLSKPVQPKVLAEVLARWVRSSASISNKTDDRPLRTAFGGTAA